MSYSQIEKNKESRSVDNDILGPSLEGLLDFLQFLGVFRPREETCA
jgi:hypothetical protein